MKKLHEIYKLNPSDTRYRHKLKLRLKETFNDEITFIQPNSRCADVVIASDSIEEILNDFAHPENSIKNVASKIRTYILSYCSQIQEHQWPPTITTLNKEYGELPDSVKTFLTSLLYDGKKQIESLENIPRLVESFAADFIHSISQGKVITPKHYLIGLGVHNMTGQKLPIQILHKFGHCITYPKVCEIETALAELSIHQSEGLNVLQLLPKGEEVIPTFFWVDNFDIKIDRLGGSSMVNTTHLMAF